MSKNNFYRDEFEKLAVNGVIGDPNGKLAFAYLRVSDPSQLNGSGMDRQCHAIHECAKKNGFAISWDMTFSDADSGFSHTNRHEFMDLFNEIKEPTRRSTVVICERVDRFSRDEFGERGYLLKEFERLGVSVIFWDGWTRPSTEMENRKKDQKEGMLRKAKRGAITAKTPAIGYILTDSKGNTDTLDAVKNTCYTIDENRRACIEFIFWAIAYGSYSVYQLLCELDERAKTDPGFKPPKARQWNERTVRNMIARTVYKGEFFANRILIEKIPIPIGDGKTRYKHVHHERPESEWIKIEVPAIVSEETWELAQKNLDRNKGFTRRAKKNEYLLNGLLRCTCGTRMHGHTDSKKSHIARYYCSSNQRTPEYKANHPCDMPSIHCDVIDQAVLALVHDFLSDPDKLIAQFERSFDRENIADIKRQIAYLNDEIKRVEKYDEKLKEAFRADILTVAEYGRDRSNLTVERNEILKSIQNLERQKALAEKADEKTAELRNMLQSEDTIRLFGVVADNQIAIQRKFCRALIDEIILDTKKQEFEIIGKIGQGTYSLSQVNESPVLSTSHYMTPIFTYRIVYSLSQKKVISSEVKAA